MADIITPELPIVPRYRFNRDVTVFGISGDTVTETLPSRKFVTGDIISGTCKRLGAGRDVAPMVEFTDENNITYLVQGDYLEPLVMADACKSITLEELPDKLGGIFKNWSTSKTIFLVVLIIVLFMIFK